MIFFIFLFKQFISCLIYFITIEILFLNTLMIFLDNGATIHN